MITLSKSAVCELAEAARITSRVSGHTHCFYRYPARFSPLFARRAIEVFSRPGDLVLDPFMGGGTTLVEARASGRLAVGNDINQLAVFIAKVKTRLFTRGDIHVLGEWQSAIDDSIHLGKPHSLPSVNLDEPYLRHMRNSRTWRLRRLIENGLSSIQDLPKQKQRDFARCALLSAGQWALDCRRWLPKTEEFRAYLKSRIDEMLAGAIQFSSAARAADLASKKCGLRRTVCLNSPASALANNRRLKNYPQPSLVLTSPPYPGVHVLYHRWQIHSRRETAFPYWIANCQDGTGSSYYTFGYRKQPGLTTYFDTAFKSFSSLRTICNKKTIVVQLVAFSAPGWQLPQYLNVMEASGFSLIADPLTPDETDPLIRRKVPNRKWYAAAKGDTPSSNEVLLIHRPR